MTKSIYVLTGVIALTISGVANSQERDDWLAEVDTDGNGTVEKSEFAAMYEKRFAETDTDGGGISLEEYTARIAADRAEREARREARRAEREAEKEANREEREARRAERDAERTKSRFERLDENGDGTVSAEEYSAAGEKMFDRMDRNDDGILNDRRDRRGRGERRGRGHRDRT